jgi:hypothetical protein
MKAIEEQGEDGSIVIDTLEIAALVINAYVRQGQIGPTSPADHGAETVLAQLSILVHQYERECERKMMLEVKQNAVD